MVKVGFSKDVHKLIEGRELILGGVKIEHYKGLLGHSDADALVHAIIEAIIGALGKKDIGTHFPDNDPKYEGISSLVLLAETYKMMKLEGYHIGNVDTLIMIEKPKMAPYIDEMRRNIANTLKCDEALINIKATRGEGLGFVGREEGVEASAIVLIEKDD